MKTENICDEITEYLIAKYTKQSAQNLELIKDWTLENERMSAYYGRELLELIQNVDDAYLELCDNDPSKIGHDVKCQITYKDNKLTIANTGT
ncbi:MAG: hypothetical protein LBT74_12450 [Acidobacteriota bacterium]|jgi:hypothetical protein|nr:hypothetical protein [Acidobacteriota bacterium]